MAGRHGVWGRSLFAGAGAALASLAVRAALRGPGDAASPMDDALVLCASTLGAGAGWRGARRAYEANWPLISSAMLMGAGLGAIAGLLGLIVAWLMCALLLPASVSSLTDLPGSALTLVALTVGVFSGGVVGLALSFAAWYSGRWSTGLKARCLGGLVGGVVGGACVAILAIRAGGDGHSWGSTGAGALILAVLVALGAGEGARRRAVGSVEVLSGPHRGAEVELFAEDACVGRSAACEIALAGEKALRPAHAVIRWTGDVFVLESGWRGTVVSGRPCEEAQLQDRDRIRIGSSTLAVALDPRSEKGVQQ